MVASARSEELLLDSDLVPGDRSFSILFNLVSLDSRLSPAIDLDSASVLFTSNRVNQPITNYADDFRVSTTTDDPNRFFYVSKNVVLENPATSIEVLLDGYCTTRNDIRVFYSVDQDSPASETVFIPFPGYANIDINGSVIDPSNNNGLSDELVSKIDTFTSRPIIQNFREHKYTIDNLVAFNSFRIKIIGTSTNMAIPPQIRNLRVISFA